jgi:hypothetical protein
VSADDETRLDEHVLRGGSALTRRNGVTGGAHEQIEHGARDELG